MIEITQKKLTFQGLVNPLLNPSIFIEFHYTWLAYNTFPTPLQKQTMWHTWIRNCCFIIWFFPQNETILTLKKWLKSWHIHPSYCQYLTRGVNVFHYTWSPDFFNTRKTLLKVGVKQMPVQMCQPLCERKLGMLLLISVLLWHYTEEGPGPRTT